METTKTNEALLEGAKVAEKWLTDTSTAMMEIYNKQLNLATGYYTNFLNSTLGNNKGWNDNNGFSESFFSNNLLKNFSIPLNGNGNLFATPFQAAIENVFKQIGEYNKNLLAAFNNQVKHSEIDLSVINSEYIETVEKRLDATKNIFNRLSEAYNKEFEFATENNKKILEEINEQFNTVIKQNQKFWSDAFKQIQPSFDGEEKKQKENTSGENKKKTALVVS